MKNNKYFKFIITFIVVSFTFLEGIDIIDRMFKISISSNLILIVLISGFIIGVYFTYQEIDKDTETIQKTKSNNRFNYTKYLNILLSLVLISLFIFYFIRGKKNDDFIENKLPAIHEAFESGNIDYVYNSTRNLIKDDKLENTILKSYYEKVTTLVDIYTTPIKVKVYLKVKNDTIEDWELLGISPLKNIRVPQKWLELKLVYKDNIFFTGTHPYYLNNNDNVFILPKDDYKIDSNFVLFLGKNTKLRFPGIDHLKNKKIGAYALSKYEVTNIEFQKFVKDSGYSKPEYWDFPINIGTKTYDFNSVENFVGEFGKPGPSNWSYSKFPKGQEDFPVTGISWFEARAYARYVNMDIPNVYQWSNAANLGTSFRFVPKSNFSKSLLTSVGSIETNNGNNIFDIAGNVREWTINFSDSEKTNKAILGGCYLDDDYFFNDYVGQNAFNRSIGNGFRLVKNLDQYESFQNYADTSIYMKIRDYYSLPGVSEEVFKIYKKQFIDYNKNFNDTIINIPNNEIYKVQRYEIPCVDGVEKMPGYIFYNSSIKPPYKPIIYFPGSNAIHLTNTDIMIANKLDQFDYLMEEGYAIIHPIYLSTYEREDELKSDYPTKTKQYKNHVINWGKEFKKTIDYIELREDLDIEYLSYYGVSWGGYMANILLAIDERVKAAVLNVAGLCFQETYEEIESYLYTPRIKCPIIMLNGKYDVFFPMETSQKPMYDLIGTETEHKKHYVYPSGHYVPKKELIAEHLNWLNKYLKN